MAYRASWVAGIAAALLVAAPALCAKSHAEMADSGPAKPPMPAIEALQLEPASLTLSNIRDGRQVLVWGVSADGRKFDLTDEAEFKGESDCVTVAKDHYVYP